MDTRPNSTLRRERPPATLDTTAQNRLRQDFRGETSVWLFGYGSLIYKVDFPWLERRPAKVEGWARRLWQGSQDHRGTPAQPGRVATLVPTPGAHCIGVAWRVAPATFEQLDRREKNGYLRHRVELRFPNESSATGIVYIADANNVAWLGPAPLEQIAKHVADSRGPSGSNRDYVLKLAAALRELGADDPHVFAVEAALRRLDEDSDDRTGLPPSRE